ncbi:MAG: alpha-ketoglutarate-dependent dioxygenase AlkB [Proteobacteria bacterium]|nr:alpha-ketoglutarate-dependent dioxygenase AlkB [Pseudomonadota bacterium]
MAKVLQPENLPEGTRYWPGFFDRAAQEALVETIRALVMESPLFTPRMPRTGTPMSVRMTNCGALGWVTDRERGYRYQPTHPETGKPWPPMPAVLDDLWQAVVPDAPPPQACLINFYNAQARMSLHQDRDEQDFSAPVVSVSLGDECLYRLGGLERNSPTRSFRLKSGDVFVLGGAGRLMFHGVDRIYPGTSDLLKNGGRINLTLRRVTHP